MGRQAVVHSHDLHCDEIGIDDLDLISRASQSAKRLDAVWILRERGLPSAVDSGNQHEPRRARRHALLAALRLTVRTA
jgi:hypothetical protein